jgi:hypothetical protein
VIILVKLISSLAIVSPILFDVAYSIKLNGDIRSGIIMSLMYSVILFPFIALPTLITFILNLFVEKSKLHVSYAVTVVIGIAQFIYIKFGFIPFKDKNFIIFSVILWLVAIYTLFYGYVLRKNIES